jgi:uncharacterized hydrophobic protein (TIGR00271 family)
MFLATTIASGGIIADSTATVIGAMLIAPLMTPIVATTAALMMGNNQRALKSIALVAIGVLFVIAVSLMLSLITFRVINFDTNAQITSRVQPTMLDLIVALAAGAAGAFAMSREDVASSLPGVAISIALVPPLCVVGISIGNGEWQDASGAFILFLTNCLSILLAGGVVFGLLGLNQAAKTDMDDSDRRSAYGYILLGVLLVAIPLALTTFTIARDSSAQVTISRLTEDWASQFEENYVVESILVSGEDVRIVLTGTEPPETISDLASQIKAEVDQVTTVRLRYVPSRAYEQAVAAPD